MSLAEAWEIVVEREPEWDDDERTRIRGLLAYERGVCECGFHGSLTQDRSNYFTFKERRCPVCAHVARYGRIQHAADQAAEKAAGENAPPGNPLPGDGRRTMVRRMSPDEVAQAKAKREAKREARRGNSS